MATHTYIPPGVHVVELRAADSLFERTAAVKITVTP
jgi:hypothetical protein